MQRRDFLKSAGVLGGAMTLGMATAPRVHAGESNTIRVGLVGAGGRGWGATIQALSTAGPTKLVAVGDIFADRIERSFAGFAERFGDEKIECPEERRFLGFDAYKKVTEAVGPGGVILLATPPCFRPLHVEYAANAGVHIFMEKSFFTDIPGMRRLEAAMATARAKNLKVAGGLYSRHFNKYQECIERIHDGAIGDVMAIYSYRVHNAAGYSPKRDGESELSFQLRNYSNFRWINGSFFLDWLIHNLDVASWIKGEIPISAQGEGGRAARTEKDEMYDHYSVQFDYPDGKKCIAQARHVNGTWGFFGVVAHGTRGSAVVGEGISDPKIFSDWNQSPDKLVWEYKGESNNGYQTEHDVLFDAVRTDRPHNESDYSISAALTGVMGRYASETGQKITRDELLARTDVLAADLDDMSWETTPPVLPNLDGDYPIPKIGA